jgi:hypothetical protein
MTGYPEYNYPAFERISTELRKRGWTIESPHENPAPKKLIHLCEPKADTNAMDCPDCGKEAIWQYYMELCKLQVESCDSIILMPGWPESRGARQELEWSLELGHKVYAYCDMRGIIIQMSRYDRVSRQE